MRHHQAYRRMLGLLLAAPAAPLSARAATLTTLYGFADPEHDDAPMGKLASDSQGNLYGTTQFGGPANAGMVNKLAPDAGALYGTTLSQGPGDAGTVFKLIQ